MTNAVSPFFNALEASNGQKSLSPHDSKARASSHRLLLQKKAFAL
jgi:hypothetical protein